MSIDEIQDIKGKLQELQEFFDNNRDVRKWKRG